MISIENRTGEGRSSGDPCRQLDHYVPDTNHLDFTPVKYIAVNIHFTDDLSGTRNRSPKEGRKFAKDLIMYANKDLRKNHKLRIPPNNDLPVLPVRVQYKLTGRPGDPDDDGIYFHYDDSLFYYIHKGRDRNLFDREVINTYGVQLDTVMNIFIMPGHPDSVVRGQSGGSGVGVFLGNTLKIAGPAENLEPAWKFRQLVNHEMGHMLGLSHAWGPNDGCDDTPQNPNCWNKTDDPPCDTMASNNVMDYNAHQNAWSPCQIAKIHYAIASLRTRARKFTIPTWCQLHTERTITIRDSITWSGMKDLEGELVIEKGGYLQIKCRVSLPRNARIIIKPGGTLMLNGAWLHNACGDTWSGIVVEKIGSLEGKLMVSADAVIENAEYSIRPAPPPTDEP